MNIGINSKNNNQGSIDEEIKDNGNARCSFGGFVISKAAVPLLRQNRRRQNFLLNGCLMGGRLKAVDLKDNEINMIVQGIKTRRR